MIVVLLGLRKVILVQFVDLKLNKFINNNVAMYSNVENILYLNPGSEINNIIKNVFILPPRIIIANNIELNNYFLNIS